MIPHWRRRFVWSSDAGPPPLMGTVRFDLAFVSLVLILLVLCMAYQWPCLFRCLVSMLEGLIISRHTADVGFVFYRELMDEE